MSKLSRRLKRIRRACLTAMLFAILLALPTIAAPGARGSPEDLFAGVTTLIAPYSSNSPVRVDGAISPNEYDSNLTYTTADTGISILLFHDNDSLYVAIQGPTWRWVALGVSSDEGNSMGFIVIARAESDSEYSVRERFVTAVSEDMTFSAPGAGHEAVQEFEATMTGTNSVAELQLSLESSLWSLETGVVYPTIVATNMTAPVGFPDGVSGNDAHFVGSYLLRPEDNARNVNDQLNGTASPVPSLVAAAIIAVGVVAIFTEFVVRRRRV